MKTKSFTLVILAIFGMVIFTNYTSKNTKETDASSLLFMLEEEKLAHDVYTFLYSKSLLSDKSTKKRSQMNGF